MSDEKICHNCKEIMHSDYILCNMDDLICGGCLDHIYKVYEKHSEKIEYLCHHNLCVDCAPKLNKDLQNPKIKMCEKDILNALLNPSSYCPVCESCFTLVKKMENMEKSQLIKIIKNNILYP